MAEILATYRLQVHAGFTLSQVRELVPYLHRLGVTHIHSSPLLRARSGSTHGYDVVDPGQLNPEVGTEEELAGLVADLRERGMGMVLDIVPNHMAASDQNPAWEDLLTHGPASRFARWFDVDWRTSERQLRLRILLPVLGDLRVHVLSRDEITLGVKDGQIRLRYFEHSFPLDPATLPAVLQFAAEESARQLGESHSASATLREVMALLRRLPRRTARKPAAVSRRREVATAQLARLRQLCDSPQVLEVLERAVNDFAAGDEGRQRIRRLLDAQVYRLAYWRRAARELNYRRFFDINDLIALHMEDPEVFAETHALLLEWHRRGWIDGFRIDHPDGLLDPLGYFRRLGQSAFPEVPIPGIWVEKILSPGERLPSAWPVAGTTGYDFLNQAESLFIEPHGYQSIEQEYRRIIRQPLEFPTIARLAKRRVLESALAAGVWRLAQRLLKVTGPDRPMPPVEPHALVVAIVETIASLPVYRTYVDPATPVPQENDFGLLEAALADARQRGRAPAGALDFLRATLLNEGAWQADTEGVRLRFVQRFQQLSGPATAKGIEDTAFYSYAPLLSRNEVGGGPEAPLPGAGPDFHDGNRYRAVHWPRSMLATTTHDTKRTADVRSRLDVLSEVPQDWARAVDRWRGLNRRHKQELEGQRAPDPNTVYHVLQAMVGVWPLPVADSESSLPSQSGCLESLRPRLVEYALKAAREAKLKTSWTEPDPEFESALQAYVEAVLDPGQSAEFLTDLGGFVDRVARPGLWNGLSRTLLHLTAPGIPDIYQGDELWNFALVDPDNRRPVDYGTRIRLLDSVEHSLTGAAEHRREFLAELISNVEDGRLKLHYIRSALQARREHAALFLSGGYEPLRAEGTAARQVFGFGRSYAGAHALVLVSRLLGEWILDSDRLPNDAAIWRNTTVQLPDGWPAAWTCRLSGEAVTTDDGRLQLTRVFSRLPGALLLA